MTDVAKDRVFCKVVPFVPNVRVFYYICYYRFLDKRDRLVWTLYCTILQALGETMVQPTYLIW